LREPEAIAAIDKLGFDVLRDEISEQTIVGLFGSTTKNICAWMMEQDKIAGIGNYIKAVTLYRCKISPHRRVCDLTDQEKIQIWKMAKAVAKEAVAAEGMGIRDYRDESGTVVGVAFDITPYGCKKDQEGRNVLAETIAGRTTWWVPTVQK
jgi:formamidopyrimidine-DNA glycosylase